MTDGPVRLRDLQHARQVTHEFEGLQGYRLLPWVPLTLLWWSATATDVPQQPWWAGALVGAVLIAAGGSWWVTRWYRQTYGRVQTGRKHKRVLIQLGMAALALGVAATLVALLGATGRWPLDPAAASVSWFGLFLGLVTAVTGWRTRMLDAVTIWFGLALAAASVVPLGALGGADMHPFNRDGGPVALLILVVVVTAIAAHRALARALPGPAGDGQDQSVEAADPGRGPEVGREQR